MSLLPYRLARAALFALEPEAAHELTMAGFAATQGSPLRLAYASTRVKDPMRLAGLAFPNRVGLAAGLDKNARCIDAMAALGFGFVEVGTVTPLAQEGNPKPRMFRLPKANALINRLGFNNEGLEVFLANVQRSRVRRCKNPSLLLGLNIGKNAATPMERATADYLTCLQAVYPHADYVTVNISSPNTKNLRTLQSDAALDALLCTLAECRELLLQRHGQRKPVFLKIAPDLDADQIASIATTLLRYGTDSAGKVNQSWGVIATNTTLARDAVHGLPQAQEAGGLSGAPVLHKSNEVIRELRTLLGAEFPIVGVGGILSGDDAVGKIRAGADVVQIYTGLIYRGPALVSDAAIAIRDQCPRTTQSASHRSPRSG